MNKHPKFQKKLKQGWLYKKFFRQRRHGVPQKTYKSQLDYFDKQTSLLENGSLDDLK